MKPETVQTICQVVAFIALVVAAAASYGSSHFARIAGKEDSSQIHHKLDQLLPPETTLHLRAVERLNAIGATVEPDLRLGGHKVTFSALRGELGAAVDYLRDVDNLRSLSFSGPHVGAPIKLDNISALSKLITLEHLNLSGTGVQDVHPLSELRNLRSLYLWNTNVSNNTPLGALRELVILDLGDTPVSDIAPLAKLRKLRLLVLYETQVTDLSPLHALENLERLDLRGLPIGPYSPTDPYAPIPVSDQEIAELQAARPNLRIDKPDPPEQWN